MHFFKILGNRQQAFVFKSAKDILQESMIPQGAQDTTRPPVIVGLRPPYYIYICFQDLGNICIYICFQDLGNICIYLCFQGLGNICICICFPDLGNISIYLCFQGLGNIICIYICFQGLGNICIYNREAGGRLSRGVWGGRSPPGTKSKYFVLGGPAAA